jgi:predicted transcriptional regulator
MASVTVRISKATRAKLNELASSEGSSMQAVLDTAVEQYRRRRFLERANEAYAALNADAKAAEQNRKEQELWDGTLADGLEDE